MVADKAVIQVFCKAPLPGQVKTRLQPQLSVEQAAQVHRELTLRTLDLICPAVFGPVELWCAPTIDHPFFKEAEQGYGVSLHQQIVGDLGARMHHAIGCGLKRYRHVLLIGCDCPSFSANDFKDALSALAHTHDAVIAPTEDGGYSLIGLNRAVPAIFQQMTWSTPTVFVETYQRLRQANLTILQLPIQWDVDFHGDYLRYLSSYSS